MKKFCIWLLAFLLWACSEENDKEPELFSLSVPSLSFSSGGGSKVVGVDTNTDWVILTESLPAWLSVKDVADDYVVLVAEMNDTEEKRSSNVMFSTPSETYSLNVRQNAREQLAFLGKTEWTVSSEEEDYEIPVSRNVSFDMKILDNGEEWLSMSSNSGNHPPLGGIQAEIGNSGTDSLTVHVKENTHQESRKARLVIYNDQYALADTLFVTQEQAAKKYADGTYMRLQQAVKGKVNVVVMGDGFTSADLREGGNYEKAVHEAVEHFFSIEPFTSYRDYFNVYTVVAESPEAGVGEKGRFGSSVDNKFGTMFGEGTEITCKDERVFEYAYRVEELDKEEPMLVILVLNSTKYAGTTYMYSDGNAIALCPMSAEASPNDFEGLVHHEAGGHGFGFLCDEYVYYQTQIPKSRVQEIKEWQLLGYQTNLDFTGNEEEIRWKDFIGLDKYEAVGAYEGGFEYQFGVWRSEANSCMNDNVPYFNVQSRWAIVNRIMELSGLPYTVEDFIRDDPGSVRLQQESRGHFSSTPFRPLGTPVLIRR